jgi:hypothetical protein
MTLAIECVKNIFTSFTNISAMIPLYYAYEGNDIITAKCIIFAALASATSHLFESHKHGLYGFGMSMKYSYLLNRCDVLGVILLGGRILYILPKNKKILLIPNIFHIILILVGFMACNIISESDLSLKTQNRFLLFHNIWHIGVFSTLGYFLKNMNSFNSHK